VIGENEGVCCFVFIMVRPHYVVKSRAAQAKDRCRKSIDSAVIDCRLHFGVTVSPEIASD